MCLCWLPLSLSISLPPLSLYFVYYFLMLNYLFIWKLFCRKRARILFSSFLRLACQCKTWRTFCFCLRSCSCTFFCCVWVCCCGGHFAKMFIRAGMRHLSKSNPKHKSQLQCSRSQLSVARKPSPTFGGMPNKAQKCVSLHRHDRGGCVSRFRFPCT